LGLDLGVFACILALGLMPTSTTLGAESGGADTQLYDVNIPSQNVADALNLLAAQNGATMLFPYYFA